MNEIDWDVDIGQTAADGSAGIKDRDEREVDEREVDFGQTAADGSAGIEYEDEIQKTENEDKTEHEFQWKGKTFSNRRVDSAVA